MVPVTAGVGVNEYVYEFSDGAFTDSCTFNVIVDGDDLIPPEYWFTFSGFNLDQNLTTVCRDISVEADPSEYDAVVHFAVPADTVCTRPSGARYRAGTTRVYCYSRDQFAYCAFDIVVSGTQLSI